jgi:hypothetical protein
LFFFEQVMKRDGEVFYRVENDFLGVIARVVIDDQHFPRIRNLKLAHRLKRLRQLLGAIVGSDNNRKLHDDRNFSTLKANQFITQIHVNERRFRIEIRVHLRNLRLIY